MIPINGPRDVPTGVAVPASVLETAKATGIEALPCKVYSPHDADTSAYLSAREDCWNKSVKDWPAVIAMPTTAQEVVAVVKLAAGKKVAVLSGGHSPMCMPNGAFLISLRKMNGVIVDPERMVVTAEGGAKIADVDNALKPHNFAAPLGTHPDTGIGGLTLGGGIGWLTPRVGLAIDNLVSAEVVLADGTLVTASAESEPELFWALRGGGGNFGLVVSFTYKVFAVGGADGFEPGMVLAGVVPFPLEAFDRATVIEKFSADCLATDADNVQILLLALGGPCISVFTHRAPQRPACPSHSRRPPRPSSPTHPPTPHPRPLPAHPPTLPSPHLPAPADGTHAAAKAALDDLGKGYGTGVPPKDGVKPMPWTDGVQTLTGMGEPNGAGDLLVPGNSFYYTAGFVEQMTAEICAFLAKAQADAPDKTGIHAGGAVIVMPLNGPFNEVAPDATAISARGAKFWVVFMLRLEGDETQMAEGIAWGRGLKKARRNPLQPHARELLPAPTNRQTAHMSPSLLMTRAVRHPAPPASAPKAPAGPPSARATGVHVDGGRGHRHAA